MSYEIFIIILKKAKIQIYFKGVQNSPGKQIYESLNGAQAHALNAEDENHQEVTVVPIATAGPCHKPCRTIYPFLILLFFMTFLVASTQMPLLMIVLRSVTEEERSFALGMQFVIFRLFGYIPAPILFGKLIDSSCLLWKSTCGEIGGRCLIYDIEQFRFKYIGLCALIKVAALLIFIVDWWLVKRRRQLEKMQPMSVNDVVGSIISLDKLFEEKEMMTQATGDLIVTECIDSSGLSGDLNLCVLLAKTKHLKPHNFDADKHFLNPQRLPYQRHMRSSSYDVKITRSNSSNSEVESRLKKMRLMSHSRTNSRDYEVVNNQINNQQQNMNANIR